MIVKYISCLLVQKEPLFLKTWQLTWFVVIVTVLGRVKLNASYFATDSKWLLSTHGSDIGVQNVPTSENFKKKKKFTGKPRIWYQRLVVIFLFFFGN